MAESLLISGADIVTEEEIIRNGFLGIKNGIISYAGKTRPQETYEKEWKAPEGSYALPGMIDIHIHGGYGADTMDADVAALDTMSARLPEEGTTSFLATTITQQHENIEKALVNAKKWASSSPQAQKGAELIGIHLEGPFVSPKKAGAQPKQWITPADAGLFQKWERLSGGMIKIVTLAPEEDPDFSLIRYLKNQNIIPSMGHTDAGAELLQKAADAGAVHMTHLFNAMSSFHHREPGASVRLSPAAASRRS